MRIWFPKAGAQGTDADPALMQCPPIGADGHIIDVGSDETFHLGCPFEEQVALVLRWLWNRDGGSIQGVRTGWFDGVSRLASSRYIFEQGAVRVAPDIGPGDFQAIL